MEDKPRRKIRITQHDPYVYQRARAEAARFQVERDKRRQQKAADRAKPYARSSRDEQLRRQSTVLGLMFAALAVFFFIGTRVAAPKLIVVAHGQQGTVLVDGSRAGRTGEVVKLRPGEHRVTVRFDDPRFTPEPPYLMLRMSYQIAPAQVDFHAVLAAPLDSTAVDSSSSLN